MRAEFQHMNSWFLGTTEVCNSSTELASHIKATIDKGSSYLFEHCDGTTTLISNELLRTSIITFREATDETPQ